MCKVQFVVAASFFFSLFESRGLSNFARKLLRVHICSYLKYVTKQRLMAQNKLQVKLFI